MRTLATSGCGYSLSIVCIAGRLRWVAAAGRDAATTECYS